MSKTIELIRNVPADVYEESIYNQIEQDRKNSKYKILDNLFLSGNMF